MTVSDYIYKAFISYRHKPLDKKAAEMVQKSIENFTIPPDMRGEDGNKKFGKVFRDEDELPVAASLSDSITYALDHSEYLIVICTPDLPESKWCEQEIRYFLSIRGHDHVIAVLADGDPETSFPPLLRQGEDGTDIEPLAANIAGPSHTIDSRAYRKEVVRIYASLLGCSFDALWQREKRARTNRLMALTAAAFAGVSIFAGTVISKNRQISEQNRMLEKQMSSMYVDSGITALGSYREKDALTDALAAVAGDDPEIYDHRAQKLLGDALGAYLHQERKSTVIYEQDTEILHMEASRDGTFAVVSDQVGYIRRIDLKSGKAVWEAYSGLKLDSRSDSQSEVFLSGDEKTVVSKNPEYVMGFSAETGETVWQYEYDTENTFRCLSPDRSVIAVADREYFLPGTFQTNPKLDIIFLDISSGRELSRITLGDDEHEIRISSFNKWFAYGSGFSDSGRMFACAFFEDALEEDGDDVFHYYLIDREKNDVVKTGSLYFTGSANNIFYGIKVDEETESMVGFQYHTGYGGIVASIFDGENETVTTEFTAQALNDRSAGTLTLEIDMNILPAVMSDHLAAVANGNLITIFHLSDGKPSKGFEMAGEVVRLEWLDKEDEVLLIVTSAGDIAIYDLEHDGNSYLSSYEVSESDQNSIGLCERVGGAILRTRSYSNYFPPETGESFFLTTRKGDTGKLLKTRLLSDRDEKKITTPEGALYSYNMILSPPSGEKLAGFFQSTKEMVLTEFDPETHEPLRSASFEKNYLAEDDPVMFDETRVAWQTTVYDLDGTVSSLERINDKNRSTFERHTKNVVTSDGHLLSVSYAPSQKQFPVPVWIDTSLVIESTEEETGFTLLDGEVYKPGANGRITGRGILKGSASETPVFVSYDPVLLAKTEFADMYPDSGGRVTASAFRKPEMACAYEEGMIILYDLDSGEGRQLSVSYAPGEIRDLCYSEDDRYLVILKNTGYTDLISLETEEKVLTVSGSYLRERVEYAKEVKCAVDEENGRMYIRIPSTVGSYGTLFGVDTSSMTVFIQLDNMSYGWCKANDFIYAHDFPEYDLYGYPVHSLADLKEWAGQALAGE